MHAEPHDISRSQVENPLADEQVPSSIYARASHLAELGAMAPLYAHEVNNLLTQLSARAQLALMRPEESRLAEQTLQAVGDCCRRIDQLTQIFLTADSPADSQSDQERHSVQEIHRRVCAGIRANDRDRLGLRIEDHSKGFAPDLMPVVLEQVLQNLLINALRAIDEHPSPKDPHHRIVLEARMLQPHDCSTWNNRANAGSSIYGIELTVEDTGVGMNTRQVTQLNSGQAIDPPSGSPASRIARHGLGLRVCRKLLATAGGAIRCDSSPNQGTRMIIMMPALKLDADTIRSAA